MLFLRIGCNNESGGGGGGESYKNDEDARRKFSKEPLKGTRISISGRGPNYFLPLRGTRGSSGVANSKTPN